MSTIHLNETTTSTPEQFVAGLTDFGPGRSELCGGSADGYLTAWGGGSGHIKGRVIDARVEMTTQSAPSLGSCAGVVEAA